MNLEDFFDPYNIDHLRAYRHLKKEGFWPVGFIPNYVIINSSSWHFLILAKLADAWMNQQLNEWQ